jgi:hypothetical protein
MRREQGKARSKTNCSRPCDLKRADGRATEALEMAADWDDAWKLGPTLPQSFGVDVHNPHEGRMGGPLLNGLWSEGRRARFDIGRRHQAGTCCLLRSCKLVRSRLFRTMRSSPCRVSHVLVRRQDDSRVFVCAGSVVTFRRPSVPCAHAGSSPESGSIKTKGSGPPEAT